MRLLLDIPQTTFSFVRIVVLIVDKRDAFMMLDNLSATLESSAHDPAAS